MNIYNFLIEYNKLNEMLADFKNSTLKESAESTESENTQNRQATLEQEALDVFKNFIKEYSNSDDDRITQKITIFKEEFDSLEKNLRLEKVVENTEQIFLDKFSQLPEELQLRILQYTDPKTATVTAEVSRQLERVSTEIKIELFNIHHFPLKKLELTPQAELVLIARIGTRLRYLEIDQVTSEQALALIEYCPNLETLIITNSKIEASCLAGIAQAPHLQSLNLSFNNIGNKGARSLAVLAHAPELKKLNLSNNHIGAEGASCLAGLAQAPHLQSLNLSYNHFGAKGASDDLAVLAQAPHLQKLNLSHNHIGAEGASFLADLAQAPQLQKLNLSHNHLGDKGASALGVLAQAPHLQSLNLSFNNIGDKGASALADLTQAPLLKNLDLCGNNIGTEGESALAGLALVVRFH